MQGRILVLTAILATLAVASPASIAQLRAQPESGIPPSRKPNLVARSIPAPDWLLWQAFYDVHRRYASRSSNDVRKMLTSRFGIEVSAAERLLALGAAYEQQIQRLLLEDRSGINSVFRAEIEAKKVSALQDHRRLVVELIGAEGCEKVERWLNTELRSHVQAFKLEQLEPSPVALQPDTAPGNTTGR